MPSQQAFLTAIFGSCLLAVGCIGTSSDNADPDLDLSVPLEAMGGGPIGNNGMDPAIFWSYATRAELWKLGQKALVDGGMVVPTTLNEKILGYVIQCAFPAGESVKDAAGNSYEGIFGLGETWMKDSLPPAEQRWVTACLLQHLNGLGVSVPLMLSGTNPALAPDPSSSLFEVDESTMYGNVFETTPSPNDPFLAFTCTEKPIEEACGTSVDDWLELRICGSSSACGLSFIGSCASNCTENAEGYWECMGVSETLRSSLLPGDANMIFEQCKW